MPVLRTMHGIAVKSGSAEKYAAAAVLTAVLTAAVWHFGRLQFSGYDLSSVINTAWLLTDGGEPYRDFFLPFPPAFSIGAKAAFSVFGASWQSLVGAACLFSAVTFNIHYLLLERLAGWKSAAVLAFLCQLMAAVLVSFWWYNSMTAIAACLFITACFAFLSAPESRAANFWLFFCLALLMLMKPNTAGFLICAATPVLLLKKERRPRVLLALGLAAAACLCILAIGRISPAGLIRAYALLASSRGGLSLDVFYGGKMAEVFISLPFLLACLSMLFLQLKAVSARGLRLPWKSGEFEYLLLALAGAAAGLIAVFSSQELVYVDIAPLFISAFLPPLMRSRKREGEDLYAVGPVFAVSFICSLAAGFIVTFRLLADYSYSTPAAALSGILRDGTSTAAALLWLFLLLLMAASAARSLFFPPRGAGGREKGLPSSGFFLAAALCVAGLTAYAGWARWRVKISGAPYEDAGTITVPGSRFFRGCRVSPWAAGVVRDIGEVLAGHLGKEAYAGKSGVFFGTRLEFAYAAFGFHAPRRLPIWWSARTSYQAEAIPAFLEDFSKRRIELGVFLRYRGLEQVDNGGGGMEAPRELMAYLGENYELFYRGNLAVFKLRKARPGRVGKGAISPGSPPARP